MNLHELMKRHRVRVATSPRYNRDAWKVAVHYESSAFVPPTDLDIIKLAKQFVDEYAGRDWDDYESEKAIGDLLYAVEELIDIAEARV